MSKEREAFEETIGMSTTERHAKFPEEYKDFDVQLQWKAWQACESHYQPLLAAKDAEIARLVGCNEALMIERTNYIETARGHYARFEKEITTLKAELESQILTGKQTCCASYATLLEQAREALEASDNELRKLARSADNFTRALIRKVLAAIKAASCTSQKSNGNQTCFTSSDTTGEK